MFSDADWIQSYADVDILLKEDRTTLYDHKRGCTDQHEIMGRGSFVDAMRHLKHGKPFAVFGPSGGILIMDRFGNLVYYRNPEMKIVLSVDDLLGQWELWSMTDWHWCGNPLYTPGENDNDYMRRLSER